MLQSNLHYPVGFLCRRQTLLCLRNGPSHGFLCVEILASVQSVQKMPGMDMQRAGHDDRIEVIHFKQAAVIIKSLKATRHVFRFVAPPAVDIGNRDEFNVRRFLDLLKQFLPARAHTNHSHPDALIST